MQQTYIFHIIPNYKLSSLATRIRKWVKVRFGEIGQYHQHLCAFFCMWQFSSIEINFTDHCSKIRCILGCKFCLSYHNLLSAMKSVKSAHKLLLKLTVIVIYGCSSKFKNHRILSFKLSTQICNYWDIKLPIWNLCQSVKNSIASLSV